jgi:hypothetical protein
LQIDWQYTVIYCGYVRLFVFQIQRIKFFAIFLWVVEPKFMKNCLEIKKYQTCDFIWWRLGHPVLARFFGNGIMVLEIFNPGSGTGIHRFLILQSSIYPNTRRSLIIGATNIPHEQPVQFHSGWRNWTQIVIAYFDI